MTPFIRSANFAKPSITNAYFFIVAFRSAKEALFRKAKHDCDCD